MNGDNNVRKQSIRLSMTATHTRTTKKSDFGTLMRNGLVRAGNVVADGLNVAAPYVPGAAIVSAALAGGNRAAQLAPGGVGGSVGGGGAPNYATGTFGLSAGGSPVGGGTTPIGNYGSGGTLAIPNRRPNLGTDLSGGTGIVGGANGATGTAAGASTDAFNQMMAATRQMTEFQASFNLQYLELQEKIQQDTRQFNLISNIMKTKHDAAKNALNNVR